MAAIRRKNGVSATVPLPLPTLPDSAPLNLSNPPAIVRVKGKVMPAGFAYRGSMANDDVLSGSSSSGDEVRVSSQQIFLDLFSVRSIVLSLFQMEIDDGPSLPLGPKGEKLGSKASRPLPMAPRATTGMSPLFLSFYYNFLIFIYHFIANQEPASYAKAAGSWRSQARAKARSSMGSSTASVSDRSNTSLSKRSFPPISAAKTSAPAVSKSTAPGGAREFFSF